MNLADYKRALKDLIPAGQLGEFFARVKQDLQPEGEAFNALILLQSRWERTQRGEKLGTIDFRDRQVSFNSLEDALLWWLDGLEVKGFPSRPAKRHIDPGFRYTCDREDQNEAFFTGYWQPATNVASLCDGKIRFFYLHGDTRQAHRELIQRFGRQLLRKLYDLNLTSSDPAQEPVIVYCKPQLSRNPILACMMTIAEGG